MKDHAGKGLRRRCELIIAEKAKPWHIANEPLRDRKGSHDLLMQDQSQVAGLTVAGCRLTASYPQATTARIATALMNRPLLKNEDPRIAAEITRERIISRVAKKSFNQPRA